MEETERSREQEIRHLENIIIKKQTKRKKMEEDFQSVREAAVNMDEHIKYLQHELDLKEEQNTKLEKEMKDKNYAIDFQANAITNLQDMREATSQLSGEGDLQPPRRGPESERDLQKGQLHQNCGPAQPASSNQTSRREEEEVLTDTEEEEPKPGRRSRPFYSNYEKKTELPSRQV